MTRINLIPVEELTDKHLIAEKHEITRVFALAKNSKPNVTIPDTYRMGKGHVTFFYNKIKFVIERYESLCDEVRRRDFNCNQILSEELLKDMPAHLINPFTPSEEEIKISKARIEDRLKNGKPKSYKLVENVTE